MRPFVYLSPALAGALRADGIGDDLAELVLADGHVEEVANDVLVFGLQLVDPLAQLLERLVPDLENNCTGPDFSGHEFEVKPCLEKGAGNAK